MDRQSTSGSGRTLAVIGGILALLLVVATVLALIGEPAAFEAGTPEAVVQEFVVAILDDDDATALTLLSPDLQNRCEDQFFDSGYRRTGSGSIVLVDSDVTGDRAAITLEFDAATRDPFDTYVYTYTERFDLIRADGEWRIDRVPWPFYFCEEN